MKSPHARVKGTVCELVQHEVERIFGIRINQRQAWELTRSIVRCVIAACFTDLQFAERGSKKGILAIRGIGRFRASWDCQGSHRGQSGVVFPRFRFRAGLSLANQLKQSAAVPRRD